MASGARTSNFVANYLKTETYQFTKDDLEENQIFYTKTTNPAALE
jgi:hypothetical protein